MTEEPIRGTVAAIMNLRELVLNIGESSGVTVGMRFAVLNPKGAKIKDPETGDELGSVDLPKVLVEVVRVQDRLSVARTFVKIPGTPNVFGTLSLFEPRPERVETLKIGGSKTYQQDLPPEDSYVKVGDPVVQVRTDEFIS